MEGALQVILSESSEPQVALSTRALLQVLVTTSLQVAQKEDPVRRAELPTLTCRTLENTKELASW